MIFEKNSLGFWKETYPVKKIFFLNPNDAVKSRDMCKKVGCIEPFSISS